MGWSQPVVDRLAGLLLQNNITINFHSNFLKGFLNSLFRPFNHFNLVHYVRPNSEYFKIIWNIIFQIDTDTPLKPNQKIYTLRSHLLPSLLHYLIFNSISLKSLSASDTKIRSAVRQCLRLPKDTPVAFFHAGVKAGGLGILQIKNGCRLLESIECRQWWHSPGPMRMSFCLMLWKITA